MENLLGWNNTRKSSSQPVHPRCMRSGFFVRMASRHPSGRKHDGHIFNVRLPGTVGLHPSARKIKD